MPGIPGQARDLQQVLRRNRLRKRGGENKAADIPQKAGVPENQAPGNLCLPYRSLPCLRHLPGYPRVSGANCFYFPARLRFMPQAFSGSRGQRWHPKGQAPVTGCLAPPVLPSIFSFPAAWPGSVPDGGSRGPRCSAGRGQDSALKAFFIRGLSFVSPRRGAITVTAAGLLKHSVPPHGFPHASDPAAAGGGLTASMGNPNPHALTFYLYS